jgi:mono/diheme cytochrome c family protein
LHPPATHLPVGLIIGGFVFALIAWIFNRKSLKQTARHCYILAFVMAIPTILLGLMDWQHRFGGAYFFEFKMKLVLAGILLFLLLVAVAYAVLSGTFTKTLVAIYALCLVTVIGLGYFGGELVYGNGNKTSAEAAAKDMSAAGAALFKQNCSACHLTDSTEAKGGPGLKSLFAQDKFPVSGKPVSDDGFRRLLKTPYSKMPPFGYLSDEQVNALLDYLKTL